MGASPVRPARFVVWPDGLILPNVTGGDGSAETLDAAASAAEQRLAEAAGGAPEPAPTGTATAPEPPAADPDDPLAGIDFDNLTYQDGKKLEKELRKDRERWRPYEQAFGGLDDDAREAVLERLPALGDDLLDVADVMSGLAPQDRAFFLNAMDALRSDPAAAAEALAWGAAVLRGENPAPMSDAAKDAAGVPTAGTPPAGAPTTTPTTDTGEPPAEAPLTRAEMERMLAERERQRDFEQAVEREAESIRAQARELGYDPDATRGPDKVRFNMLVDLARDLDGDLAKAHAELEAADQARLDALIEGKRADAQRPSAPAGGGSPSSAKELTTLDDSEAAMRARLEAALGPDPRRR